MKIEQIKNGFAAAMAVVVLLGSSAFATTLEDKTTEKTREAVENAGPHDWYTLAKSAEKCFKKKVNLKEAYEWLDQSIEIAETPINMELKGDYYNDNQLPDRALEYYVRAMNIMKENDGESDVSKLQKKISKIINIGG